MVAPPNWIIATVGDVLRGVEAGKSEKTLERRPLGDDVGVVKVSAVTWGEFDPAEAKAVQPSQFDHSKSIRNGDLLFSRANTVELAGAVVHVTQDHPHLMLSDKILRLLTCDEIAPRYLMYSLRTADSRRHLEGSATGTSTSMRNITQENLRKTPLPLPPAVEQLRIVAKLDDIFEQTRAAKARLERLPALLEKLKRSILAAAFRGDLTNDWRAAHPDVEPAHVLLDRIRAERHRLWEDGLRAKGKDPRNTPYEEPPVVDAATVPVLPAGWAWTSLEALTDPHRVIRYGILMPGEDFPGGVPYVKVRNIKQDRVRLDDVLRTSPAMHAKFKGAELAKRDLLVTIRGTWGRVAPVPPELVGGNITQDTARIAPLNLVAAEYLASALRAPWSQTFLDGVAKGIAVKGVNITDLRCTPIPIPSPAEQARVVDAIAGALASVASIANHQDSALTRVSQLEKAALATAFRGELVRQDPADEPASVLLERIHAIRAAEPERTRRRRGQRQGDTVMAEASTVASNGNGINGHHDDSLDLVVAVFQQVAESQTATSIAEATGLTTAVVKKALDSLAADGQVRVHGSAHSATYEWTA